MNMRQIILNFLFFLVFSFVTNLSAQTTSVFGTITDENGEALIGATVMLQESQGIGTITDIEGKYNLEVDYPTPFTLVASYTGFSSFKILVEKSGQIDITLTMDA
jgi:hypothetical protein